MVTEYVCPSLRVCISHRRVSFYAILICVIELWKSEIGFLSLMPLVFFLIVGSTPTNMRQDFYFSSDTAATDAPFHTTVTVLSSSYVGALGFCI